MILGQTGREYVAEEDFFSFAVPTVWHCLEILLVGRFQKALDAIVGPQPVTSRVAEGFVRMPWRVRPGWKRLHIPEFHLLHPMGYTHRVYIGKSTDTSMGNIP